MKKNSFIIFLLLLIFSCDNMETVVDLDVPEAPPVLVLNAMLDTDIPVQLLISHSVGAFSQEVPSCIDDAEVLLYENNQLLDTLQINLDSLINYYIYSRGSFDSIPMRYYESDIIPNKNTTYKVEASHPDYPSIVATTYIPEDLEVDFEVEIDVTGSPDKLIIVINDNGTPNDDSDDFEEEIYNPDFNPDHGNINGVELIFDDNPNQDNFYRLKLYASCYKESEEDGLIEKHAGYVQMMSNDPSFESSLGSLIDGYSFTGNQVVFSDALFNGQEKNIRLDIETGFRYENCDTVRLQFSIFSADTYSYYNSLNDHRAKGPISIFGGEVIPVYSNVENGLGSIISINDQIIQIKP